MGGLGRFHRSYLRANVEHEPGNAYIIMRLRIVDLEKLRRVDGGKRSFAQMCGDLYGPLGMKTLTWGCVRHAARRVPIRRLTVAALRFLLNFLKRSTYRKRRALFPAVVPPTVFDLARFIKCGSSGELNGVRLESCAGGSGDDDSHWRHGRSYDGTNSSFARLATRIPRTAGSDFGCEEPGFFPPSSAHWPRRAPLGMRGLAASWRGLIPRENSCSSD